MVNKDFEVYKIKRELKRSGTDYEFTRDGKNEFDEPSGSKTVVGSLRGLYHEENGTVQITTGETTRTRTKKVPKILCLYESITSLGLKVDDTVTLNGKVLKVTGVVNVQEWDLIGDISLEVVDDGIHD